MNDNTGKLTVTEKIGYGFGDMASNLFWQMFSIYILKFYTDVFLLGAAAVGTMMLVTRLLDAFIDPLIGTLADRTNTRWGHFRPYLLWMAIPMAVSAVLTFTTPSFGGTARLVYAYVTLILMMIAYSGINIPYSALLGVLTPDSKERTSASSYRFVMAFLPIFVIAFTAPRLVAYFGGSDTAPFGWQMTMVVYSLIAVVLFFVTFAMTKERVQPPASQHAALGKDVGNLFRNVPWVVLCIVGIAALTYGNIRNGVMVYYFDYVVTDGKEGFKWVLSAGAAAFMIGVMATAPLSKRFGKRRFYMFSMAISAVLSVAFYFVPTNKVWLVVGANTLISLFTAPTAPLVWAMYADTADYSEWKWGRRATGLIFSAASFAQKLGWAIGGAGTAWLLSYFGYVANVPQSAHTIKGMMLMTSVIPAVAAVIAVAALWFYKLDDSVVETMGAELAARRKASSDGETVAVDMPAPPGLPSVGSVLEGVMGESKQPAAAAEQAAHRAVGVGSAPGVTMTRSGPVDAAGGGWTPGHPDARPLGVTAEPPLLTSEQEAALRIEFAAVLNAGVHGLCFSPYLEGQAPGSLVSEQQIRERLAVIQPYTRWVRTFSCTEGHEQTPELAHRAGLKTLVGAWLGTDRAINEREIEGAIAVARAGHADLLAVGNEVLLRGDLTEDELLAYMKRVKDAVPHIEVGYVDAYFLFEKHPRVTAACDVVLTNCYPFWEGCPRDQAIAYMQTMHRRTVAAAAGKRVIVSETGWPHTGSAFHGAVPSVEGAMRYFIDTCRWAQQDGVEVFYFAAFDEAWKVGAEGDVGAYWGLWDKDGRPKYL